MEQLQNQQSLPRSDWEAVDILAKIRWPEGFRCRCSETRHRRILKRPRVFACKACGHQTSVTAGTTLGRTRVPLKCWFLAAALICRPAGCSAAELQRRIGTCYETAWKMMHRIREAMEDPDIRLIDEPMVSGLAIWCQRPGREEFGAGLAWVWAATDGERVVSRYSSIPKGGRLLAAQHSDTLECDEVRPNAADKHLVRINIQTHITHFAVSQKWLPRYLVEIDYRENHLRGPKGPNIALRAAVRRRYLPFSRLVPDVWCPPGPDLEGPFLGPGEVLIRMGLQPPPPRRWRRRDFRY